MRIIIRPKLLNRVLAHVAVPTSLPPDGGCAQVARVASKLAPKKYGPKIDATPPVPDGGPIPSSVAFRYVDDKPEPEK